MENAGNGFTDFCSTVLTFLPYLEVEEIAFIFTVDFPVL